MRGIGLEVWFYEDLAAAVAGVHDSRLFDFDADTIEHDIDVWREHWIDQMRVKHAGKDMELTISFQIYRHQHQSAPQAYRNDGGGEEVTTQTSTGIFRHYKGPLYQAIGLAHDANADSFNIFERIVVVYFGLQLDSTKTGPRLAVRSLSDWNAYVHTDIRTGQEYGTKCENFVIMDQTFCHCDAQAPHLNIGRRFTFLGETFEPWMPYRD